MRKLYYTWTEFEDDCWMLAERLKRYRFKTIISLARGSLPIGVKLSHILKAHLTIISVLSYENKQKGKTLHINTSYVKPLVGPILILDDVADSGESLTLVRDHLSITGMDMRVATLFYKPKSIIKPNTYIREVSNDTWIYFPWENWRVNEYENK